MWTVRRSAHCFANGMIFKEDIIQYHNSSQPVNAKVTFYPAIVQMLAPKPAKSFQDYADNNFTPYILHNIGNFEKN